MSVADVQNSLSQLLALQKQVNAAIEMLPPSTLQYNLITRRSNIRQFENSMIFPYQSQLLADVLPGFLVGVANQLASPIAKAISVESSILAQSSGSSSMSGSNRNKFSHPLGQSSILSEIEAFVTPSSGPTSYSADDTIDIPAGQTALGYYFTESTKYPDFPYTDLQSMIDDLDDVNSDLTSTIGFTIRTLGLSSSQVQTAMNQLADTGQGELPSNTTVFFTALTTQAEDPSFWSAISFVAVSTFQEAVQGAQALGQQILTAAATTTAFIQYLPYLALAGVGVYIFIKAGGIEGISDVIRGKG